MLNSALVTLSEHAYYVVCQRDDTLSKQTSLPIYLVPYPVIQILSKMWWGLSWLVLHPIHQVSWKSDNAPSNGMTH